MLSKVRRGRNSPCSTCLFSRQLWSKTLSVKNLIDWDMLELAFRVRVEAAHPDVADAVTVHGVLLNPVCQEELYNPGRDVSINSKENPILTPQRAFPDARLGCTPTRRFPRRRESLSVRLFPFREVTPTMALPGETDAGSAGKQPCRGIARRAHRDDDRGRGSHLSRSTQNPIGSKDPDTLKIPARRAASTLARNAPSPVPAEPAQLDRGCAGKPLLGSLVLVRNDVSRPLGEEFLFFGRKPDISADPTADIPGCDLGDAHLFTPQCDGNGAGKLNRLLALPDGYRWRGRRNEGAVCLCNDGARLPGELFLAGARKPGYLRRPSASPGFEGFW